MSKFLEATGKAVGEVISHKAILEIKDYNAIDMSATGTAKAKSLLARASNAIGGGATNLLASAQQTNIANKVSDKLGIDNRGYDEGVITVQYNPASIKYSASVTSDIDPKIEESLQNASKSMKRMVTMCTGAGEIDFSFTLVFHRRFAGDQSVKQQMELILNMLYSRKCTKEVTFSWANMVATGRLISFSGKYDMFETTGNPMSGSMDMTIRLATEPKAINKVIDKIGEDRNDKLESGAG
jgi:hypothetical protein